MALNRGKEWEQRVAQSWKKSFPGSFLLRLSDQQSGYRYTSSNPCDFIGFVNGKLFLIECKSVKGNTVPFNNLRQYSRLIEYIGLKDVNAGFLVWWEEKDKVAWIPIETVEQLKKEAKKSIHLDILEKKEYNTVIIPFTKKRVYVDCDFSILKEI